MSVPTSLQPFDMDALLKERKWYIAKDAAKSLVDDRDLTRYCDKLPPASLEQVCKTLRDRRYETNPEADLKVFPGTWRIVNVSYKLSESTAAGQIFQLLRLGFITTLKELATGYDSAVAPDDEVRVVKVTVYPQSNVLELIRRWPYVDPTKADEIIVQLKARKTVTNPTADSQVYAGTFTVQDAYSEKQDDGSCDIVETLSLGLYADWNYTYAKNCKEDIKLVSKEGLSADELTTALLAYQRTPGTYAAGVWNNVNISFDKTKGLYNLNIEQHIGVLKEQTVFLSYLDAEERVDETRIFNSTTDTPIVTTRVEGETISENVTLNEFCLYDKVSSKRTSIKIVDDWHTTDIDEEAKTKEKAGRNLRATDLTGDFAPVTHTEPADVGKERHQSRTKNKDETFDVRTSETEHYKQTMDITYTDGGKTQRYLSIKNGTAAELAAHIKALPTSPDAQNSVSGSENKVSLFDYTLTTRSSNSTSVTLWPMTKARFYTYLRGKLHETWIFTKYYVTSTSNDDAYSFASNLASGLAPTDIGYHVSIDGWWVWKGSGVRRVENGLLYLATRVELKDPSLSTA